jgi:hypothetical protein
VVLLGSPADGGQMFFFHWQLSKVLNMFDRPKHCFGTKVCFFLPTDDGFLSKTNVLGQISCIPTASLCYDIATEFRSSSHFYAMKLKCNHEWIWKGSNNHMHMMVYWKKKM